MARWAICPYLGEWLADLLREVFGDRHTAVAGALSDLALAHGIHPGRGR